MLEESQFRLTSIAGNSIGPGLHRSVTSSTLQRDHREVSKAAVAASESGLFKKVIQQPSSARVVARRSWQSGEQVVGELPHDCGCNVAC